MRTYTVHTYYIGDLSVWTGRAVSPTDAVERSQGPLGSDVVSVGDADSFGWRDVVMSDRRRRVRVR